MRIEGDPDQVLANIAGKVLPCHLEQELAERDHHRNDDDECKINAHLFSSRLQVRS
ncbi:MAG: hypothetical protein R3D29_05325 [Nitratireductor sp.]